MTPHNRYSCITLVRTEINPAGKPTDTYSVMYLDEILGIFRHWIRRHDIRFAASIYQNCKSNVNVLWNRVSIYVECARKHLLFLKFTCPVWRNSLSVKRWWHEYGMPFSFLYTNLKLPSYLSRYVWTRKKKAKMQPMQSGNNKLGCLRLWLAKI